jgi:hypothetical protein
MPDLDLRTMVREYGNLSTNLNFDKRDSGLLKFRLNSSQKQQIQSIKTKLP